MADVQTDDASLQCLTFDSANMLSMKGMGLALEGPAMSLQQRSWPVVVNHPSAMMAAGRCMQMQPNKQQLCANGKAHLLPILRSL
jgi:hypothetical protein